MTISKELDDDKDKDPDYVLERESALVTIPSRMSVAFQEAQKSLSGTTVVGAKEP